MSHFSESPLSHSLASHESFLGVSMVAAWYVWSGKFTVGDFVLFCSYVEQLYNPLTMFSACYRILQDASVNMDHMIKILQLTPDIADGNDSLSVSQGTITFDNVYFQYTQGKVILKDIAFTIPAGQTYAIVGSSGSGKSTILKLLLRFYDVTMGKILIDGQDISKVTLKSLRQSMGVLQQAATLFNQSAKYNIRYGKPSADDSEIIDATKEAQIHDEIMDLTDGYDTKVGENGVKLSGGQKRRIAIARALLEGAGIVLLDEAATGLDNKTDSEVWASLKRFTQGKTTLIVSHQLSSIMHADNILVLGDGQIVEQGTHSELRRNNSLYEELWLLEHHDHDLSLGLTPSFTCTATDCKCACHVDGVEKLENASMCSGMDCYCNCHDLEVEQEVLAILKQECEEGEVSDEDEDSRDLKRDSGHSGSGEPFTASGSGLEESSDGPPPALERSRSRISSNKSDILLETIREVPSTEEREAASEIVRNKRASESNGVPVRCELDLSMTSDETFISASDNEATESDPFVASTQVAPRTKPHKIRKQRTVDFSEDDDASSSKVPPASPGSVLTRRMAFTRSVSQSFADDESIKLIVSGKSFNVKPKRRLVGSLIDDNLDMMDRSLPASRMQGLKKGGRKAPPLQRSKTVDVTHSSCPLYSFEEIKRQKQKKQEKLDKAQEKEWNKAKTMIDQFCSTVSLLPEELGMMDSLPDHLNEDSLNPLSASINATSLGLQAFREHSQNSTTSNCMDEFRVNMDGGAG